MTSEKLDELIQKYVQQSLSESEADELSCYLEQEDAKEARWKLRLALKADAFLEEAAAEMGHEAAESDRVAAANVELVDRRRLTHAIWALATIAAMIAVGFFGWFRSPDSTQARDAKLGVATVLRIDGEGRVSGGRALSSGDAVLAGDQLTMSEGLIELAFRDSGVHAIATAPLTMTAESSKRIFLHRGDAKLHVPPQGIGFVVETKEREITDLGTMQV
jgi:hypothetical protein